MDFFNSLQIEGENTTSKTLKGHDMDLSMPETQTQTNIEDDEDSYTNYQRDLILGLDDPEDKREKEQNASDTSYMSGIRKRLLEKKKIEEEKKSLSALPTQLTQVLTNGSAPQIKSTQIILSNLETQKVISQDVTTQLIQTSSIKETQILQSNQTQIVEEGTQIIDTVLDSDDDDDEVVGVKRKVILNSDSDSDDEILPTQKLKRSGPLHSDDEVENVTNNINRKKVSFIGSDNDNYDETETPTNTIFNHSDLKKTADEKNLEDSVMYDDLFTDDKHKEANSNTTNVSSEKIQSYHSLSKKEKIKARAEAHRLAREEKEKEKEEQINKDLPNNKSISDSQFVSKFNKDQDEKANVYQKMKQKEKKERIEQAKLIQEAADAITNFDATILTKDKLLAQLAANSEEEEIILSNTQNTIDTSPQKPYITKIGKIDNLISKTIVKNQAALGNVKSIELDVGDSDSSDTDEDNSKDKLRLLELKRKMVQRSKQMRDTLHRESSLDEKIRKQINKQLRKHVNKDKSDDLEMTTEDMVVELLHRDQMRDAELFNRQEKERKLKAKQNEMMKNGIFPSHDDDPEFSQSSEGESDNEDVNIGLSQREDIENEEKEEEEHFVSPDLENIDFKTTQTDAFKKLGISMTQLFDNGTQSTQSIQGDSLTTTEKFQALRGNIDGLQKIDESVNESVIEIHSNNVNSTIDASLFLAKMVDDDDDSNLFSESQSVNKLGNFNNILGSQIIELNTQVDALTQADAVSTQDNIAGDADEEDEDEEEKITFGRKRNTEDNDSDVAVVSENEEEIETEEEKVNRMKLLKLMKEKEKKLKLEREKKMKEMGLNKVMENEADESEDEFKGIGGEEGEASDVENSEDERMIDDARNIQLNEEEIRQKVLENELAEDKALVEKTYKDVKTHKLRERRAKDGVYDMELSDDDDDEYFKLKMLVRQQMEKKQIEFEGRNKVELAESNPQKPFFDAMAVKLPSRILSFQKENKTPSVLSELVSDEGTAAGEDEQIDFENRKRRNDSPISDNKKRKIPEPLELDIESLKEHDIRDVARNSVLEELSSDDEDGSTALKHIKSTSSIKLSRHNSYRKQSQQSFSSQTVDDDVDNYSMLASRTTSITSSFKKATAKKVRKGMFTGNVIREVTVTTNSRSALNSKSAVTKLVSKDNENDAKRPFDESADRMSSLLAASRKNGIRKLGNSKFRR